MNFWIVGGIPSCSQSYYGFISITIALWLLMRILKGWEDVLTLSLPLEQDTCNV